MVEVVVSNCKGAWYWFYVIQFFHIELLFLFIYSLILLVIRFDVVAVTTGITHFRIVVLTRY